MRAFQARRLISDEDRARLDELERKSKPAGKRRMAIIVAVAAVAMLCFGALLYSSIAGAHKAATQNVPWKEVLYEMPESNWLRAEQAIAHRRFYLAVCGLITVPFYALMAVLWGSARTLLACMWRTVRFLQKELGNWTLDPENSGKAVQDRCPPPRGRSWFAGGARASLNDSPPFSAAQRCKVYKAAKVNKCVLRLVPFLVYPLIALVAVLLALGPLYLAWRANLPWLEGYQLAIAGHDTGQTYSVAQVVVTDYALRAIAIVPYLSLALAAIWRPYRLRRRFEPQVVAAMHVLDVILWRRAKRRASM